MRGPLGLGRFAARRAGVPDGDDGVQDLEAGYDGDLVRVLRLFAVVCLCVGGAGGCRSTPRGGSGDASSSAPVVVDASVEASAVKAAKRTVPCPGDDPYMQGPPLIAKDRTGLPRSLFPEEQREPRKKGEWRVPSRVEMEVGVEAPKLVLASETFDQCDALSPGQPIAGPFHNVPSSADWKAMLYANAVTGVIVVRDDSGVVRAMRRGNLDGANSGMEVTRLELFDDGVSLLETSYESADGSSTHILAVFDFVGPELREILNESVAVTDGALDRFDLKVLTRSATPEVSIDFSAHPAPTLNGMSKAQAWIRKRRFDAKTNHFR